MAELSDRQRGWLATLERTQRLASLFGALMVVLGASYVVWAVAIFDPLADPRDAPRWDKPVAAIAEIYDPYRPILRAIRPATENERVLHEGVTRNLAFSTGIMILLVRTLLGTVMCLGGLAMLTVVVERSRLLKIIGRLREAEPSD